MADRKIAYVIEEDPEYKRDVDSHAVINNNVEAFEQYKARREQDKKASDVYDDVATLKSEIGEIKSLLRDIIRSSRGNNG